MKLSKMSLALALVGLGFAGRNASAITTTVVSLNPGTVAPVLTYNGGLSSVSGNFALTGLGGVVIPAGDLTGVTLTFTGFTANGAATSGGGVISQSLNAGTFTLTNSSAQVILTGVASSAFMSLGIDTDPTATNNAAGSYFSLSGVTYSAPAGPNSLQAAINAAGYGNPGAFTFSLTGFDNSNPVLNGANVLQPFSASINGQLAETSGAGSGAPLPAAAWGGLSMMGALGGIGAVIRRRRR